MIKSTQSGLWSDTATWGGKLPTFIDSVAIDHDVTLDMPVTIAGMTINHTLNFDSNRGITLTSTGNIVVNGMLEAMPNTDVVHTIRFTNINENSFVGGGDQVLDSDIGLWVIGAGVLALKGQEKTSWTNSVDKVYNSNYLKVNASVNWKANDELLITPTSKDAVNYDERKLINIDASGIITLDRATTDHPVVAGRLTAEVANLTRNLRIEGRPTGYSHIFIKSSSPQMIKYCSLRYMGPRRDINGDGVKELVTGRYAIHFHHSEDGSRGTMIEGNVVRDCSNHCFVPHGSHGITMRDNIAYNVLETPFWYDLGHKTNDLLWEGNLVAKVGFIDHAQDQDSGYAPTFGAGGFLLGFGDRNVCRNNVVVGTTGDNREGGAYIWPEIRNDADVSLQLESQWGFENNTAHNCPAGISDWQNNNFHHIVRNTNIYNCDVSIFHGAYQNDFHFIGGMLYSGYIDLRAASATTNRVRFENVTIDAAGDDYCVIVNEGPLAGASPIVFRACQFQGYGKKAILDQNPGPGIKRIDVIDCGVSPDKIQVGKSAIAGEYVRLQEGGKAWKITKSGAAAIAIFAPQQWGTGTGLQAQYFTPDFKTLLLSRVEPNVNLFDITHPQIDYAVPGSFAVRWTGKIQPQYSESYTFYLVAGGGVRFWIDNKLIIDKWAERYPGEVKAVFGAMIAGKTYDLKLEFFNNDDRSGCTLEWSSTSLKREFVPMSQLYTP